MNLWTNLLNTYEKIESASGIIVQSDNPDDNTANEALLPLNHMTLKVSFKATINQNAELVDFESLKKPETIIIPCTEASMGRTSKPVPHPLCDQIQYVDADIDAAKTTLYLEQLNEWKGENQFLNTLYQYVSQHSLSRDALALNGTEISTKDNKLGVAFYIETPEIPPTAIVDMQEIREQWIAFSSQKGQIQGKDMFGQDFYAQAENFPKNIVSTAGNAKILSANDSSGFTFRGRFANRDEALSVDSLTSQKIHNTLRWLVRRNGFLTDSQAIVIWQVEQPSVEMDDPGIDDYPEFDNGESDIPEDDATRVESALAVIQKEYSDKFRKVIYGDIEAEALEHHAGSIVVLVLDAASTGRLSVRYYQELQPDEYIENLAIWHSSVAWDIPRYEKSGEEYVRISKISSPSFRDIIRTAFKITDTSSNRYKQLAKATKQALIECMFEAKPVPRYLLEAAFNNVKRPLSYDKMSTWQTDFSITCGLWKQYYNLNKTPEQKEITMGLDREFKDRSYLYGRLLAVADCFEERVLQARNNGAADRATNALRFMGDFSSHPYKIYETIEKKLNPYIQYGIQIAKLRTFTKDIRNEIDEIKELLTPTGFASDEALSPMYSLGYSHERKYIKDGNLGKKDTNTENETNSDK